MDLRELPQNNTAFRRHPWEVLRARFFSRVLSDHLPKIDEGRVLDIGAGDGWFASQMLKELPGATGTCWDYEYTPETISKLEAESNGNIRFRKECPEDEFDLLLLMDILEHIDDDKGFLTKLARENLRGGAHVLVSVPAWQSLFTSHDATFSHRRRYSKQQLERLLHASGLEIITSGGLFHSLLLPRTIKVFTEKITKRLDREPEPATPLTWKHGDIPARLIESVLGVETNASLLASKAGIYIPGLSTWALCRPKRT